MGSQSIAIMYFPYTFSSWLESHPWWTSIKLPSDSDEWMNEFDLKM